MPSASSSASSTRPLRVAAIASFLLAFPLCLVHGVLSHDPVPAAGLVPLASSAGISIFLLLRHPKHRDESAEEGEPQQLDESSRRPIFVFTLDVIHAAALLVVLVFTWIHTTDGGNAAFSMLAAYATIPILINFFVHLYLAVSALYTGLAIHDLIQYLAWQAVPPDCPNCNHRLRPESTPEIPWFRSAGEHNWKFAVPSLPAIKVPEWKTPAWLKRRGEGYSSLFVREEERYQDEPEDGEPSSMVQPEATEVIGKNNKKGKSTPILGEEPNPLET